MQVLDGCPWVLPRPVFLLTSQQWGWQAADGIQSTYTLRIKVVKEGAADAIAQVSCGSAAAYTACDVDPFLALLCLFALLHCFACLNIPNVATDGSRSPTALPTDHTAVPNTDQCIEFDTDLPALYCLFASPVPAAAEQAAPSCGPGCV